MPRRTEPADTKPAASLNRSRFHRLIFYNAHERNRNRITLIRLRRAAYWLWKRRGADKPGGTNGSTWEYAVATLPSSRRMTVALRPRSREYTKVSIMWPPAEVTADKAGSPYLFVIASTWAPLVICSTAGNGGGGSLTSGAGGGATSATATGCSTTTGGAGLGLATFLTTGAGSGTGAGSCTCGAVAFTGCAGVCVHHTARPPTTIRQMTINTTPSFSIDRPPPLRPNTRLSVNKRHSTTGHTAKGRVLGRGAMPKQYWYAGTGDVGSLLGVGGPHFPRRSFSSGMSLEGFGGGMVFRNA